MTSIPAELAALMGKPQFAQVSDGAVETGAIRLFAAAVEDGTPTYWADDPADVIAPPALLSAWNRPVMWHPDGDAGTSGLALHFLIKDRLGLPRAIVAEMESEDVLLARMAVSLTMASMLLKAICLGSMSS